MYLSISDELQLFAEELYEYLTPSFLENLARELGFVKRKRKFSGYDLATICVWISQRVASDSLVRLCSQLHASTGTLCHLKRGPAIRSKSSFVNLKLNKKMLSLNYF